jgi:trypsin
VTIQHGSVDLYKGTTVKVSKVIPHEDYKDVRNDVALLKMAANIQFDAYTRAIALRSGSLPFGTPVTISGFGQTSWTSPASDRLKYNLMMVVSDKTCAKAAGVAYDGLFCINAAGENGACRGDSGGPGILNNALVGVANFVIGGCGTSNPDGYARVSYFIDWIKANTKDSMMPIMFV